MSNATCSIEGCTKPAKARTWCAMHWARWRKWGDPSATPPRFRPRTCSIYGCDEPHKARGWCNMHWTRWQQHGDPERGGPGRMRGEYGRSVAEIFRDTPKRRDPATGCIEWTGDFDHGYGRIQSKVHGSHRAHRVAYELARGPIPDGMHVCHSCDNPPCVNPDHLFLGDDAVNVADMLSKMRHSYGTARYNHVLDEERVLEILRRYDTTSVGRPELAREFGVAPATVQKITERGSWKHVEYVPTGRLKASSHWAAT